MWLSGYAQRDKIEWARQGAYFWRPLDPMGYFHEIFLEPKQSIGRSQIGDKNYFKEHKADRDA